MSQHLNVLLSMRSPEVDTGLQVWPHQHPVEGNNQYKLIVVQTSYLKTFNLTEILGISMPSHL